MDDHTVFRPNPEKIKAILAGYPLNRVVFIITFMSAVIDRLKTGSLYEYNWAELAGSLGIYEEVDKIIEAFDMTKEEFYAKYGS